MPRCAVLGCLNDTLDTNGSDRISWHIFPRHTKTRLKWIWATGRQYWDPPKWIKICSNHFKEEDFVMRCNGGRYLIQGTVPTIDVFNYPINDKETTSNSDDDEEPATSTDCQMDDDDDIICIEPSPKRKKIKLTQGNDNIVQKLEVPYDEFQMFANNIAAQLRTLPLDVALNLQTEMYKLVAKERSERYRMSQQVDAVGSM